MIVRIYRKLLVFPGVLTLYYTESTRRVVIIDRRVVVINRYTREYSRFFLRNNSIIVKKNE